MKTTIDIADPLLEEARRVAARNGVTIKSLVEQGLRKVLAERPPSAPFRLRRASVTGQGLSDEWQGRSWDEIRAASYGIEPR